MKCPVTGGWINKEWFAHAVEYNLTIKRNTILIHSITWMNLKIIILMKEARQKRIHAVYVH